MRPVRSADNLTTFMYRLSCNLEPSNPGNLTFMYRLSCNLEPSNSWKPHLHILIVLQSGTLKLLETSPSCTNCLAIWNPQTPGNLTFIYRLSCNLEPSNSWKPHLHVPIVLQSGTLKLLETSRSVQACNGSSSVVV
jgi:hypothetical protein